MSRKLRSRRVFVSSKGRSCKHKKDVKAERNEEKIHRHLIYIAATLSFFTLIAYMLTRDIGVLNSCLATPFLIIVGYHFGNQKKGN